MLARILLFSSLVLTTSVFAETTKHVSEAPQSCVEAGDSDVGCILDRQNLKTIQGVLRDFRSLGAEVALDKEELEGILDGIRRLQSTATPPLNNFRGESEKCNAAFKPLFTLIKTKLGSDMGEEEIGFRELLCSKLSEVPASASVWSKVLSPWTITLATLVAAVAATRYMKAGPRLFSILGTLGLIASISYCPCKGTIGVCPQKVTYLMTFLATLFAVKFVEDPVLAHRE